MGGYSRQRKSPSCLSNIFNIFFGSCCSGAGGIDDMSEDGYYVRRAGDEGEPGIDGRASAFIA
ncbi:hypothetical protein Tsubulata_049524, partial [Turnera subulata]